MKDEEEFEKDQLERDRLGREHLGRDRLEKKQPEDENYDDSNDDSYDDDYDDYDDNDDYDDYDDYEDDYDNKKLGEEQFDKTIDDKDYYKNKNEELEKDLENAQKEADRDTLTLDKDGNVIPNENNSQEKNQDSENNLQSSENLDAEKQGSDEQAKEENPEQRDSSNEQAKEEKTDSENGSNEKEENSEKNDSSKEKDNGNEEKPSDDSKKKSNNEREVVAVNKDGSKVVKKNKNDHRNDQKNVNQAKKNLVNNKLDEKMAKAYGLAHPIEAAKKKIKAKVQQKIISLLAKFWPYILAGIGIIIVAIILFCLIGGIISYFFYNEQSGIAGYYDAPCQEITVIGVYNERTGNYSESGTYSVEDYVAGVLASEVGNANNMEVYKAFAIAIRTYTFRNVDSNCAIENSTRKQTFTETTNETLIQAAKDTMGIVLVDESGSLVSTMYDSCYIIDGDINSDSITIGQKNQVIDGTWYRDNVNKFAGGGHGQGMSQCGAYYLGDSGYTYDQILQYYYDNIVYKSTFMTTGIEGLEEYTLDSTGTQVLRMPLDDLLNSYTIDGFTTLNQRIIDNVNQVGYQTRGGVVAAAVTLIGEVGKYGYRVPYFWGGGQGFDGISEGARNYWGGSTTGTNRCIAQANNRNYDLCGLDCAGFVNWAIYNAGFRSPGTGSGNFSGIGEVVSLRAGEAVVQAGDLIHSPGHIVLVVGVDFSTNEYIIAEAAGYNYGVLFSRRGFDFSGEGVKMDAFYNNEANKR